MFNDGLIIVCTSCASVDKLLQPSEFEWWLIYFAFPFFFPLLAIAVSRDHKPDQTDERRRIEDAGGFVMWAGKVIL